MTTIHPTVFTAIFNDYYKMFPNRVAIRPAYNPTEYSKVFLGIYGDKLVKYSNIRLIHKPVSEYIEQSSLFVMVKGNYLNFYCQGPLLIISYKSLNGERFLCALTTLGFVSASYISKVEENYDYDLKLLKNGISEVPTMFRDLYAFLVKKIEETTPYYS